MGQLKIIIFEIEKKETFRYREEKMTAIDINENKPVSLNQKRQRKDWLIRHIPVKVKGRSPRPYRVPKLISSIVMGVCLYLAVHLNAGPRYQVTHRPEMLLVQWLETWSIWNIPGLLIHDSPPVKTGSNQFLIGFSTILMVSNRLKPA